MADLISMKTKLTLLFLLVLFKGYSQEDTKIIRGRITNAFIGSGLSDVVVSIVGKNSYFTKSDSLGYYEKQVSPGTYAVILQRAGFKTQQHNIVVLSGKQQVQDFFMEEYKVNLDSVTVVAVNNNAESIELDMWNMQRYAAAFYDPARMSTSYAAIMNADDQANNVLIHGSSPNYIQWKLEGVEIANPNHLENGGTVNDRPTLNGGSVSLFSAQLLQNSNFQLSAFDPSSGNALTGIFDMKLRNGNNEKYEHIIQVSLLGTDISMEGPFMKKKGASFLFNYRYSTIGLLSLMGINFGGELTNFQDFSAVVTYPLKKGQIKLFGILGNSETIFRGEKDSLEFETEKDLRNIDYHSFTSINGLSFLTSINNTTMWKTVVAYSAKDASRSSRNSGIYWKYVPEELDRYQQQKISTLNYLSKRFGNSLRFKAGTYVNYFTNEIHSGINDINFIDGKVDDLLIQPFVSLEGTINKFDYRVGLHGFCQPRISENNIQPRAMLTYNISGSQWIRLNYGTGAQLQPAFLYLSNTANRNLKPTLTSTYSFIHHLDYKGVEFRSELFYQYFSRVPVNEAQHFSAFNYYNEQLTFPLESKGKGESYGYDLSIEKHFLTAYFVSSVSIFQSDFTIGSETKDSRFNSNYNFAFTAGKEYALKNKNKILSTDARFFCRNGFFEPDPESSQVFVYNSRMQDYYRVDLRISYRKNRRNSSVIWALDIQNISNHQNPSYHYYDSYTEKIETHYQQGIVPVLSYKILF